MQLGLKLPGTGVKQLTTTPLDESPQQAMSKKWELLVLILLGAGICFRLFHYFDNRSLWIDEIYLSSSIIRMNYAELMTPALDYEQKAPIGFLWLVRTCVVLFGTNEMALRLIPLLCGIGSLLLFLPVCRYFLKPMGMVIAMGTLAMAPPLVYHAVEIKQYSMELFASILALYQYTRFHNRKDKKALFLWGIYGAVLVWFSYSAIIILAGIAGGTGLVYLFRKNWPAFFRSVILGAFWLASFAANFLLFTNKYANSEWLVAWFDKEAGFMPFPPKSGKDLMWYPTTLFKIFYYPLGLWFNGSLIKVRLLHFIARIPFVPLVTMGFGLFATFKQNRKLFWVLLFPVLFMLGASAIRFYPFYERLLVFLAPALILFVARGAEYMSQRFAFLSREPLLLPVILLTLPLYSSLSQVVNTNLFGDYKKSYYREALLYINDHYQPGDVVYAYWNVHHNYKFYKEAYKLKFDAILGSDFRYQSKDTTSYLRNLDPELNALRGNKRVWVLNSKYHTLNIGDFVGTPAYYQKHFDLLNNDMLRAKMLSMGKEIDAYKTIDNEVRLYDLSGK